LPDTVEGYVDASEVTRLDVPLRRLRTSVDALLLDAPRAEAPMIGMLKSGSEVEVLGRFESFDFVRDRDQRAGWVETSK
jgi:hypothetical protein